MKAGFIFATIAFGFVLIFAQVNAECEYDDGNGQPNCDAQSIQIGIFRNNWDPTRYWVCNATGPGIAVPCEDQTGYLQAQSQCVPWNQWQWTPPCNPPSRWNATSA